MQTNKVTAGILVCMLTVAAHERANELRRLLDEQRISNGEALDKISQLLAEATQREQAIGKPKKRVKSKVD
jgi:hypothetical protein